jgi:di/tricarboxylate transporter
MLGGIESSQLFLFIILIGSIVLLFTEWIRIDLTAVLIILMLSLTGVLEPEDAFSGFSSEPAILLAAVFVLNGALYHTGLSEQLGDQIKRLAGKSFERAIGVVMPSVALLSAFTHHVTITALMLPPTLKLARENNIPASKLLIPLSFAASLGTAITIIGAPAFLISDGLLKQAGQSGLGIFSIAPIGLALSLAGTIFFLLLGRFCSLRAAVMRRQLIIFALRGITQNCSYCQIQSSSEKQSGKLKKNNPLTLKYLRGIAMTNRAAGHSVARKHKPETCW